MTNKELMNVFQLHRHIFGVCPTSGNIFRLSECDIYKEKPQLDLLQKIEASQQRIDNANEKFNEKECLEEKAKGREKANKAVEKFDKVFNPKKINPDDSNGIFHPVDYIVFNGMKAGNLKNVLLIDRIKTTNTEKRLQKSIDKVVENENYEWITFRVENNGSIKQE